MSKQVDLKALISHIVKGDGENRCRICMGDTTEGQVFLGDTVMMEGTRPVSLSELLENITGIEVKTCSVLPNSLCFSCCTSALSAVSFKQNSEESARKWLEVTEQLSTISQTKLNSKTMYVIVENDMKVVLDSKKVTNIHDVPKYLRKRLYNLKATSKRTKQMRELRHTAQESEIKCPNCGQKFISHSYLQAHLNTGKWRMCWICHDVMHYDEYQEHLGNHDINYYPCDVCSEIFAFEDKLNDHMKKRHTGTIPCVKCGHTFNNMTSLNVHITKHDLETCSKCQKNFFNVKCVKYHMKSCTATVEDKYYICDYCSKNYKHKNSLRIHIENQHTIGLRFICDLCDKLFSSNAHLLEHYQTHQEREKNYVCQFCDNKYVTKSGYRKHLKKHII